MTAQLKWIEVDIPPFGLVNEIMSQEAVLEIKEDKRLYLTISPSSLDSFQTCPRKYFYDRQYTGVPSVTLSPEQ